MTRELGKFSMQGSSSMDLRRKPYGVYVALAAGLPRRQCLVVTLKPRVDAASGSSTTAAVPSGA
jgi:hypothetical protein